MPDLTDRSIGVHTANTFAALEEEEETGKDQTGKDETGKDEQPKQEQVVRKKVDKKDKEKHGKQAKPAATESRPKKK